MRVRRAMMSLSGEPLRSWACWSFVLRTGCDCNREGHLLPLANSDPQRPLQAQHPRLRLLALKRQFLTFVFDGRHEATHERQAGRGRFHVEDLRARLQELLRQTDDAL